MAVAGGNTPAYQLSMQGDTPVVERIPMYPRSRCVEPDVAVTTLRTWTSKSTPVVVAGPNMAKFYALWEEGRDFA